MHKNNTRRNLIGEELAIAPNLLQDRDQACIDLRTQSFQMYKIYIITLILSSIIFSIIIATISYKIDPFDEFSNNTVGMYFGAEREFKRAYAKRERYDVLLMGSSKVNCIPTNKIKELKIFNAAFPGALPEELFYFLRDVNPRVKRIAIGLDFFMFNEKKLFMEDPIDNKKLNQFKYLFSTSTFYRSLKALYFYLKGEQGQLNFDGTFKVGLDEEGDYQKARKYFVENGHFNEYKFSNQRVESLKAIKKWCFDNRVELIVWVNPYHSKALEYIHKNYGQFWKMFLSETKRVFPDIIDLSNSKYSSDSYFWSNDCYHYYPTTGIKIMKEILAL